MRTFNQVRIKNIERKPMVFGMQLAEGVKIAVNTVLALVYLMFSPSWTHFAGVLIYIVVGYIVIRALYSSDVVKQLRDKQLPDQIINK